MSDESRALILIIVIGMSISFAMGRWMGQRDQLPPPPEMEICRLEIP